MPGWNGWAAAPNAATATNRATTCTCVVSNPCCIVDHHDDLGTRVSLIYAELEAPDWHRC